MKLALGIESKPALKRVLLVTALMATTMIALTASASAGVVLNTIDHEAILGAGRRLVAVTGPLRCSGVERARIRVTVSQRTTGAVAEGRWRGLCRRTTTTWTAKKFVPHGAAMIQLGTKSHLRVALFFASRSETGTTGKTGNAGQDGDPD